MIGYVLAKLFSIVLRHFRQLGELQRADTIRAHFPKLGIVNDTTIVAMKAQETQRLKALDMCLTFWNGFRAIFKTWATERPIFRAK